MTPKVVEGLPPHFILFFGRMVAYKGLDLLMESWKSVSASFPDLQLVLAGTGPERPKLEERTIWIDRILSDEELVFLIDQAELVAAPYIEASQSGVVATAMAREKIIVSTNVGGLKEQIEDGITGFLAEPNSASFEKTLRKALLLSPQEKNQILLNIKEKVQSMSWKRFIAMLLEKL